MAFLKLQKIYTAFKDRIMAKTGPEQFNFLALELTGMNQSQSHYSTWTQNQTYFSTGSWMH